MFVASISKNHLYSTDFYYINEFVLFCAIFIDSVLQKMSKIFMKWNEEYRIQKKKKNNQSYNIIYKFTIFLTIRLLKKLIIIRYL